MTKEPKKERVGRMGKWYRFFRAFGNDRLTSFAKGILMLKGQRVYLQQSIKKAS